MTSAGPDLTAPGIHLLTENTPNVSYHFMQKYSDLQTNLYNYIGIKSFYFIRGIKS